MRYHMLDNLRGLNLISMILYHLTWDLVYLFGVNWEWYQGLGAYLWQQAVCWIFIFLSGFCCSMGKRGKWKRGGEVFLAGFLVTVVTCMVMPDQRVVFGVLTLLGSCMLIWNVLECGLKYVPNIVGFIACLFLFVLLRNVEGGYLGLKGIWMIALPRTWYANSFSAYLGFPPRTFFSTDYFPLFPWFFLFLSGYFFYRILQKMDKMQWLVGRKIEVLSKIGKHSLPIYMLHQPVLYAVLLFWFEMIS